MLTECFTVKQDFSGSPKVEDFQFDERFIDEDLKEGGKREFLVMGG